MGRSYGNVFIVNTTVVCEIGSEQEIAAGSQCRKILKRVFNVREIGPKPIRKALAVKMGNAQNFEIVGQLSFQSVSPYSIFMQEVHKCVNATC
ncbi:MAG: hypothetical protein BGO21_17220 [Dyadobacter sp. 50-39]|nr:MAG: hypothetical protein BGO21_17220 [Dyadobacter sp. 50-39]